MLVHVNSKFRDAGSSSYDDFVVTLNKQVKFNSVKLLDCVIPQSFYVINSNNNTFYATDQYGNTKSGTITPGSYTTTSLIPVLQTAIDIAISDAESTTVYYLPDQNVFKIQCTAIFNLLFSRSPKTADILGFSPVDTGPGAIHVGDKSVNLAPDNYMYLQINGLGIPQCVSSLSQSFTFHFPVALNGDIYTVSKFASESDYKIKLNSAYQDCGQLQIKLLTQDGELVGMRGNWGFTLLLSMGAGGGCGCG